MTCKTTKTCTKVVQTPADDEWRIHMERWSVNGDQGDGLCGGGFLEKISLGDGAECQSLCAATDGCKHYCYLDGGSEGNCRTYGGDCGAYGKRGGMTPTDSYTCYDKPSQGDLQPSFQPELPSEPMVGIFGFATTYETFVKNSSTCGDAIGPGLGGKGFLFHGHRLLCEDFEETGLQLVQVA